MLLKTKYPIIMAPMFLVTNVKMMINAGKAGIAGCIPAHNFRSLEELQEALIQIKKKSQTSFGVNLIVNKSNPFYLKQLEIALKVGVDFIITSLGSPQVVIEKAHEKNTQVFCDVTDLAYAQKVERLGADAVVAVNSSAGGHAGKLSKEALIKLLKSTISIPIISAGGVGDSKGVKETLDLGVAALSIGTVFIASDEACVSADYKKAIVQFKAADIVMTSRLSGTPCTIINTPYVKKIGIKQNFIERVLNKNKKLKKWFKAITFYRGMKSLEKAAFGATYKTLWCAGPSIEFVHQVRPIKSIVEDLTSSLQDS